MEQYKFKPTDAIRDNILKFSIFSFFTFFNVT